MSFDGVFMLCCEVGWTQMGSWSDGRGPCVEQVHWQLELLSRWLVSLRGRVVFWWQHKACFASGSACMLKAFFCDKFPEWVKRFCCTERLVSQHATVYFSRNFSMPAQQLSAAWLWSHLSLSDMDRRLVSISDPLHKAKLLLVMARHLQNVAENSLVTLTRTLAPGLLLKAHDKKLLDSVNRN